MHKEERKGFVVVVVGVGSGGVMGVKRKKAGKEARIGNPKVKKRDNSPPSNENPKSGLLIVSTLRY